MSQAGVLSGGSGGGGGTGILDITGNSGGAVGADGANNINLLGSGTLTVTGSPGTNTLTISQNGTVATSYVEDAGSAIPSAGILNIVGGTGISTSGVGNTVTITATGGTSVNTLTGNSGGAISPTAGNINTLGTGSIAISGAGSTLTTQLTGMTNHAVLVGAGTATLTPLTVGTNGQVLVGATTADPAFATLTSSDSSITFTTGANSLSLQVAGGTTVIKTITGNSGGAESPSAGNFSIVGTGSITVAGTANTETVQLTGLTNHNVLLGAGTATITNVAPSATSGVALVSNGAAADPSFTTVSPAGGGTGRATLNSGAVLSGNGVGNVLLSNSGTAGQIFVAQTSSTSGQYITATAGTGLAITANATTFKYDTTGGGLTWQTTTANLAPMLKNNGYIAISAGGALTFALPSTASSTIGDTIAITLDGATSWQITQAASQQIRLGNAQTTAGATGTITSTAAGDSIKIVYQAAGKWNATSFIGTLTVA